ncbi:MAG: hypothetical protein Kow0063_01570 [Anaerolineae bacterium]
MPVKLLITYNIKPTREEAYYRFMTGEFLPAAQSIGLQTIEAWRTVWGDYPQRLIEMVAESPQVLQEILDSERWRDMETRLERYVDDYQRRMVPYRNGFQFLKPR